jgi:predicted RNA-binding protein YlxR (DUF448 family)
MRRELQAAMIRMAVVGEKVRLDDTHRSAGRGGYLHRSAECLAKFERSRVKEFRSLRRKIGAGERNEITESVRSRLARSAELE